MPAAPTKDNRIYIGTSGWAYSSWKPGFYPAGVSAKNFLAYYAGRLNSVEVNYTFRKLPTAVQCKEWLAAVPEDFQFCFKAPQRITHFQRLKESKDSLAEFMAAIEPFRRAGRLGLVLFQLPPNFKADVERLRDFMRMMAKVSKTPAAFEFRNATWFCEETYAVLRENGCTLSIAANDELETPEVITARVVAYRLRRSDYSNAEIRGLAKKFDSLAQTGHSVYAYFKHEDEPTGALRAVALRTALKPSGVKRKTGTAK